MKKLICLLTTVLFIALSLTGCATKGSILTQDNEILTYQRIDPDKTQIVVSRTGNIEIEPFCRAFEERNPDVQVIYLDITGGNSYYKPLGEWIKSGYTPDVAFAGANFFDEDLTPEYFVNLSADPVIDNYEAAALVRTAVNGEIYSLPGPSNINAMMYNKTLFEQYGWEVPSTFDEFVALCERITEDTQGAVVPWNPNAKYDQEMLTAMEGFTYEELFGGADNRAWYNDFVAGNGTFANHMEPYMEAIETLVERGILKEEHFSYSATTRGKEFAAGNIAMINVNIYEGDNEQFDFGYFPFPTTQGELGYVCDSYSCFIGIPVKEHTEAEDKAVRSFIEFFSSVEGQQEFIGSAMKVSNVKDVPLNQSDDLAALLPTIQAGHMFAPLNFESTVGMQRLLSLQQCAIDITTGVADAKACIAAVDANPYREPDASQQTEPDVIAAAEDMTVLEFSCYIADMYREAADADIGLVNHGVAYRGNLMRTFEGDIRPNMVTVFKPRSFANDSTLVKLSMTGKQIIEALNNPVGNGTATDSIYAFSGLKCTVAPWSELGAKYISIKLADGSALDENKLYTVAAWAGTVADEYITETLETFEGTWEELATAKMSADGIVKAADDGRIKLVWD